MLSHKSAQSRWMLGFGPPDRVGRSARMSPAPSAVKTIAALGALAAMYCLALCPVAFGAGIMVGQYGAKCDGHTDDTEAIRRAVKAAEAKCHFKEGFISAGQSYIELPMGSVCKITKTLVVDTACVGVSGNGATIDATAISKGSALVLKNATPASPYTANVPPWEHFSIVGPGSSTSSIGIRLESGNVNIERLNVVNFGTGIEFGNFAFNDVISGTAIWNVNTGLSCPSGLKDAGEQLSFINGRIFNSGTGLSNDGCDILLSNSQIDGIANSAIINVNNDVILQNVRIEYFRPISHAVLTISGGCNAYTFIRVHGGLIQNDDTRTTNMPSLIDNSPDQSCRGGPPHGKGPWVMLQDVFLSGIQPKAGQLVTGPGKDQVRIECATNGAGGGTMCNTSYP